MPVSMEAVSSGFQKSLLNQPMMSLLYQILSALIPCTSVRIWFVVLISYFLSSTFSVVLFSQGETRLLLCYSLQLQITSRSWLLVYFTCPTWSHNERNIQSISPCGKNITVELHPLPLLAGYCHQFWKERYKNSRRLQDPVAVPFFFGRLPRLFMGNWRDQCSD